MKVLVCGGRDFSDKDKLFSSLDEVEGITEIIHGNASGADKLAGQWAKLRGKSCTYYPADWKRYGKMAGPIRNARMLHLERPKMVVAFPGGAGTRDMIRQATEAGVTVRRIT